MIDLRCPLFHAICSTGNPGRGFLEQQLHQRQAEGGYWHWRCAFQNTNFISIPSAIETVDSYELDIEAIYRRHSVEEMSVPVMCWTINFGCSLNDNEFLYFLAPQQIANYWMGLEKVKEQLKVSPIHFIRPLF